MAKREAVKRACKAAVADLTNQQQTIRAKLPQFGSGPRVHIGPCQRALAKAGGYREFEYNYSSHEPGDEAIACLEIQKQSAETACTCAGGAAVGVGDASTARATSSALAKIRRLGARAIGNREIADYVKRANLMAECSNTNTVRQLDLIGMRMESLLH